MAAISKNVKKFEVRRYVPKCRDIDEAVMKAPAFRINALAHAAMTGKLPPARD